MCVCRIALSNTSHFNYHYRPTITLTDSLNFCFQQLAKLGIYWAKWDQKDRHHRDSRLCNCMLGATSSP